MRANLTNVKLTFNAEDTKMPSVRIGKTKTDIPYMTVGFRASYDHNGVWVENFSMDNDVIKTKDVDGNDIEVSKDDVNDPDIISNVANYKKHIIVMPDGTRNEFISDYEFNRFIYHHQDELKEGSYTVTANISKNFYNGTVSDRFQLQNIYAVTEETKPSMKVSGEFFYAKDGVDTADWKSEKKLIINGYTREFIDKSTLGSDKGAQKYVPLQVVFDCSKLDFENEKHINIMNFKLKQLGLEYSNGAIKNNLKNKNYYVMGIVCNYINGAEEIPFDESLLTDNQKEAIELGIKTLDDFKPKGQTFGNRVTLYKLCDFNLNSNCSVVKDETYADGFVDTSISINDFEDEIFVQSKPESAEEVISKATADDNSEDDDDVDDLFG